MNRYIAFTVLVFALMVTGCSESQSTEATLPMNTGESVLLTAQAITALPMIDTMTAEIAEGLIFMREEEKVARDVYEALAKLWNLRVLQNISVSEQRHMDALKVLIDRYGLEDPVSENARGVFVNPDLQRLHNDLVARGSQSVQEALLVGILIEEVDIADLNKHLQAIEAESDIAIVYQNLKRGSENHLSAFLRNLERF